MTKQLLPANQKLYFEVTLGTFSDGGFGVGNPHTSAASYLGADQDAISWYFGSPGQWSYNGTQVGNGLAQPTAGNNASFAIDGINKLIWARLNGGNWNGDILTNQNPATKVGGFSCNLATSGTIISPGSGTLTDGSGNVYSIDASTTVVFKNGTAIPGSGGTDFVEYSGGVVYYESGGAWYTFDGANFQSSSAPPAPSVGVFGGKYIYLGMTSANSTQSYTLNAGSSAFTYSPPLGFRSPDSSASR